MFRPAIRLSLCLVLAHLAVAVPAHGQEAADRNTARTLFDEGLRLYRAGNYQEACPKFEASVKLVDALGARGKLAECYEKLNRVASAWAMYKEVAELAKKAGEARREQVATERANRLEPNLSFLTITVAPGPHGATRLTRNGVPIQSAAFGSSIAVDAGAHEIVATADDHEPWRTSIEVAAKGRENVEVPVLKARPAPPKPAVAPALVAAPGKDQERAGWRTPTAIGLVAGGGATLATGLVFGALAKSKWDSAFDDGLCDRDTKECNAEGVDETDSAKSQATVSTVLVVGGLALAGAGVALWLWPEDGDRAVSVSPMVGTSDLGFALSGRF